MSLSIVSKWSPDANPCLSSVCVQVNVGCITSFPQLVKYVYKGVEFYHDGITFSVYWCYEDGSCGKYCWMSLFVFMEAMVTSWMFVRESVEGVFH